MAVTKESLRDSYPEFDGAPDSLVDNAISRAELMVDRSYYGAKADMAITCLAAHYIAINPLGEMARLIKDTDKTTYKAQFDGIKRSLGAGCRVI